MRGLLERELCYFLAFFTPRYVRAGSDLKVFNFSIGRSHKKPPAGLRGEIPEGLGVKLVLN